MRFPKLTLETTVQVDDKTRLDASLTFVTDDETITNIEIQPESIESFISVFVVDDSDKWFLDWAYEADGQKAVIVRVTTDAGVKEKTYLIDVLTEVDDALFSGDADIYPYEPDLNFHLPKGKNSWLFAHRAAQTKIIAYLDEQRIWKQDGTRFSKLDVFDKEEFKRWSMFQALLIVFESLQSRDNDIFEEKRIGYEKDMREARNRASLRLDVDGDGVVDEVPYNIRSTRFIRR